MVHLLRFLSWRHLLEHPLRSALTIGGVAIGVATMVAVTAINRSVLSAFRSTIDTIAGKADLSVSGSQAGFDDALVERVRALPGVAHASGSLTVIAPVEGAPGQSLFVMGVDLLDDGHFRTYEGVDRDVGDLADDLEFLNSTDRILVSERFASERRLKVNDSLGLVTPSGTKKFFVHGLVKESGPVKAFGGSVALMYVGSAQEAFERGRRIDRIDVAVAATSEVDAVAGRLRRELGTAYEVDRPERRGGSIEKMVRSFQMGLNLGSGVALLVGLFLVYNTVAIGVVQRRREIGTLRALGATKLRIRALFALEAGLFGCIGTAAGLPLGSSIARAAIRTVSDTMATMYVQVNAREVQITAVELGLGIALGVLGSVLAALRPATLASQVQPVEALRRDVAAGSSAASLRSWPAIVGLGLLLLVYPATRIPPVEETLSIGGYLAIFFVMMGMSLLAPLLLRVSPYLLRRPGELLLGISGGMAAQNFSRAPARTAVPVSALAIGVAMTVCIGGFVGSFQRSSERWIDQSVPADLFVTSSAKLAGTQNMPMLPSLGDELEKLDPAVSLVDKVRIFRHDVLGLSAYVVSLTPEIYNTRGKPEVLEGRLPERAERDQGAVTISENLARRRGLHVGDEFEMTTPTGARRYRVAAVIVDYTSDQGTVFMDRRVFVEHFKDDRVDTFELYLNDPGALERVRRAITERFGEPYHLYVLSNRELRQEAHELVDGAFSVTYAMEAVAVLLALLGVINTLLAAILDRTREIGLLRAVGAGRGHILRLVTAEAAFIGLTGGLLGVAAGVVMGLVVTGAVGADATGWAFAFLFPWRIAGQMVLAATACAVIAGLYPARRAAGLDVVEALAYE